MNNQMCPLQMLPGGCAVVESEGDGQQVTPNYLELVCDERCQEALSQSGSERRPQMDFPFTTMSAEGQRKSQQKIGQWCVMDAEIVDFNAASCDVRGRCGGAPLRRGSGKGRKARESCAKGRGCPSLIYPEPLRAKTHFDSTLKSASRLQIF